MFELISRGVNVAIMFPSRVGMIQVFWIDSNRSSRGFYSHTTIYQTPPFDFIAMIGQGTMVRFHLVARSITTNVAWPDSFEKIFPFFAVI